MLEIRVRPPTGASEAIEVRIRALLRARSVRRIVPDAVLLPRELLLAVRERARLTAARQQRGRVEEERVVAASFRREKDRRLYGIAIWLDTQPIVVELEHRAVSEPFVGVEVQRRDACNVPPSGNSAALGPCGPIIALLSTDTRGERGSRCEREHATVEEASKRHGTITPADWRREGAAGPPRHLSVS